MYLNNISKTIVAITYIIDYRVKCEATVPSVLLKI